MAESPKKKVVKVDSPAPRKTTKAADGTEVPDATWTPTPEAKKKAVTFRIIALVLWALAIAAEAYAIFGVLRPGLAATDQNGNYDINMVLLVGLIVGIAALAIGGSLLWKQANRLDPASKKQPVKFWIQNQLGLIITIIAFLPLIILIFTNKNMNGQQKAIAGGVAIVLALLSGFLGTTVNAPSVEQYSAEQTLVDTLTGDGVVYWVKGGKVFHLCDSVPAVQRESKDGQIYAGSIEAAHQAGKERLTKQVKSEIEQCGITVPEGFDLDAALAELDAANAGSSDE